MIIKLDNALCDRSPGCPSARVCPTGAIVPVEGGAYPGANGYRIIDELCRGCAVCVRVCGGRALTID
ncbi:4Fe-4S ferredoxin [bacterium]|nr:4Fe-4S ferredoxin [bacterium]